MRDPTTGERAIAADVLRQLLEMLPPDATVRPNSVGNLMVRAADGQYLGYIDLRTDELDLDTTDGENAR